MTDENLQLKTRLQTIYYQREDYTLGITYATSDKRLTYDEARIILDRRNIPHVEILKVKYDTLDFEIPESELEQYLK